LVEPTRTNLFTYSNGFEGAAWTKVNVTTQPYQVQGPDGTNTGSVFNVNNSTTGLHTIYQYSSNTGGDFTFSIFAKKGVGSFGVMMDYLILSDVSTSTTFNAIFNLNTGTLVSQGGNVSSTKIIKMADNWYRYSVTFYSSVGVTVIPAITISPILNTTYTGNSHGAYIYGAQLEAGEYLTSYISTSGSMVTRAVDNIQNLAFGGATAVLASLSSGTFMIEAAAFQQQDFDARVFSLRATADIFVSIQFQPDGQLRLNVNIAGNKQAGIRYRYNSYGHTLTDFNKIAISWGPSGIFGYVNGTALQRLDGAGNVIFPITNPTYLPAAMPAYLFFHRGDKNHSWAHSKIKKALVFKNQLSQAECIALTK
jgi:hypothetical protein